MLDFKTTTKKATPTTTTANTKDKSNRHKEAPTI